MKISSILAILISTLFITSCKEEPTKPSTETNLTIEILDKSCTEVWIDIKANDQAAKLGSVYLNDEFKTQFYLKDTVVYLDELLPNETYTIKLTNQDGIGTQTEFTTMDTTSHNFTWETFEFGGEGGSSYLRDVAIINENDIWAVGEIFIEDTYTYDSNGVWQHPYNAVHWDGNKWELKRIFVDYRGQPNFAPLEGVFALPDGKIIFSSGLPYLPEGDHWKLYHLWDMGILDENDRSVTSIWGTSLNNLYFVGRKGTIVHYNGSSWSKIESGTTIDLISLTPGEGNEIFVSGYDDSNGSSILLKIKEGISEIIWQKEGLEEKEPYNGLIYGMWSNSNNLFLSTSNKTSTLFRQRISDLKDIKRLEGKLLWRINSMDGKASNDIVTLGDRFEISHYNGSRIQSIYRENISSIGFGIKIKENIIISVGTIVRTNNIFNDAYVVIGRR